MEVHVFPEPVKKDTYNVSIFVDMAYYQEYQIDAPVFLKRVQDVARKMKVTLNPPEFQNSPQGDHVLGKKARKALHGGDEAKGESFVVVKPKHLHDMQGLIRKQIEKFFLVVQNAKGDVVQRLNRTNLAKGDDIHSRLPRMMLRQ